MPAPGDRPAPSPDAIAHGRRRLERALPIPAATFLMGSDDADAHRADGEGPVRPVHVPAFRIDAACVTVEEFAAFVADTGHVTTAERLGWSYVFAPHLDAAVRRASPRPAGTPWWRAVEGARWDAPEGPGSDAAARGDHPVVHVSVDDARAFAAWCGMRLPREAEWERAARGGLEQARYPWGDDLTPGGEHRCNIFQGLFPMRDDAADGFSGTAPARWYEPNGLGLFQCVGNVWEHCADAWDRDPAPTGGSTADLAVEPAASPAADPALVRHVLRGGSFLCHDSYCNRYCVAARTASAAHDTAGNSGFRLAADATPGPTTSRPGPSAR
ncbi:formylglycine-generating enzyme family protein [Brachybacterium huguangmaarense]